MKYTKIGLLMALIHLLLMATIPDNHQPQQGWIIGAIVGAALTAGSIIANRRNQKKGQQETLNANLQLQQDAFDKEKEMWELQNKYNDPSAQMSRLEGAGLNPMQIYGSGSNAANQAAPAPSYEAPRADFTRSPIQIPEMLGMYQDFQMKQAQIDNVKAQTESTEVRTVNEDLRKHLIQAQKTGTERDNYWKEYLRPYQSTVMGNEARQSEAKTAQEWQKLRNMTQDEQLKLLVEQEKTRNLTAIDLENEKRQADILYKKYQNQWMKEGVTSSDNPFLRIIVRMLGESGLAQFNPFQTKN